MRRRRLLPGMLVLLCVVGCGGGSFDTISLSKDTLQTVIDQYFPMSSDKLADESAPVTVTLTEPEVLLEEGRDQLGLRIKVDAETEESSDGPSPPLPIRGRVRERVMQEFDGTVTVYADITYQQEEAAFYILNPSIEEVTLQLLPEPLVEPVHRVTERLLAKYLQENPVYRLSEDDVASRTAKRLLNSVTVKDGKLNLKLGL